MKKPSSLLLTLAILFSLLSSCAEDEGSFGLDNDTDTVVETPVSDDSFEEEIVFTTPFTGDFRLGINTQHYFLDRPPQDPAGTNQAKYFPMDSCLDATVDSEGNHICVGYTARELGSSQGEGLGLTNQKILEGDYNKDVMIMKTDPEGRILWIRQLGKNFTSELTEGNDWTFFVQNGDGFEIGDVDTGGDVDTSKDDECRSVVVDSSDNIYCVGTTYGNLGAHNAYVPPAEGLSDDGPTKDIFFLKVNKDGGLDWIHQIGQQWNGQDLVANNYFPRVNENIGGEANGYAESDFKEDDHCSSLVIDETTNTLICGGSTKSTVFAQNTNKREVSLLINMNTSGDLVYFYTDGLRNDGSFFVSADGGDSFYNSAYHDVAFGPIGDLFIYYYKEQYNEGVQSGTSAEIQKLAPSNLRQSWSYTIIDGDVTSLNSGALAVDNGNNVYYAGSIDRPYAYESTKDVMEKDLDAFVGKLNYKGRLKWVRQIDPGFEGTGRFAGDMDTMSNDYCVDLKLSPENRLVCLGITGGELGDTMPSSGEFSVSPFLWELDKSGNTVDLMQYGLNYHQNIPGEESVDRINIIPNALYYSSGSFYFAGESDQSNFSCNGGDESFHDSYRYKTGFLLKFNDEDLSDLSCPEIHTMDSNEIFSPSSIIAEPGGEGSSGDEGVQADKSGDM